MEKLVSYAIRYCNSDCCPWFYHNYDDHENVWCDKLKQKIYDFNINDNIDSHGDCTHRKIPPICPLPNVN